MSSNPSRDLTNKMNLVCSNYCDRIKKKKKTQNTYLQNSDSGNFKTFE